MYVVFLSVRLFSHRHFRHCFPTVIVLVMNIIIRIATVTSQTKQEDFQKVIEHYGIEERRRYNQEKAKARWWSIDFLLALNVK